MMKTNVSRDSQSNKQVTNYCNLATVLFLKPVAGWVSTSWLITYLQKLGWLDHYESEFVCIPDLDFRSPLNSIGLPYFHRKKGGQFTTVTYLSVLSHLYYT